jgi:hypothetical protein
MNTEELKSDSYLLYALMMSGTSEWGTKLVEQHKHIYGVKTVALKDIYKAMSNINFNSSQDEFDGDIDFSYEEEVEIIDAAYRNAFKIATGEITFEDFMQTSDGIQFFAFDPSYPETFELIIDDMIEYFEESEEYEKCQTLLKLKYSKTLIQDLEKRIKSSEDDT